MADFCEAFVDVGTSAQYVVPTDLIERFGLEEVDYENFVRLYAAVARINEEGESPDIPDGE